MTRTWVLSGCLAVALVAGTTARTEAAPIINNTGLAAPGVTITFSEHVFATDTPITDQYADLGVTFDPGLYYDVQPVFFPTQSLANFSFSGGPTQDPSSIRFLSPVTNAAVAVQTNAGQTTFTALLNGVAVESFTADTLLSFLPDVSQASNFYGFSGILFDELQIDSHTDFFQIDNLQFNDTVPEPASALLLLSGLGALAARRARRKAERL